MNKIQFNDNKTLRLTNVLIYQLLLSDEKLDLQVAISQMQSYIRVKGSMQIGPLIQYTKTVMNENGELGIEVFIMIQCSNYIHNVECPYAMEAVIRVPNALYCRYMGPEAALKYAYDKISLEAFEHDVELEKCNYTIYVDKNSEDDVMIADVFVPKAYNG